MKKQNQRGKMTYWSFNLVSCKNWKSSWYKWKGSTDELQGMECYLCVLCWRRCTSLALASLWPASILVCSPPDPQAWTIQSGSWLCTSICLSPHPLFSLFQIQERVAQLIAFEFSSWKILLQVYLAIWSLASPHPPPPTFALYALRTISFISLEQIAISMERK